MVLGQQWFSVNINEIRVGNRILNWFNVRFKHTIPAKYPLCCGLLSTLNPNVLKVFSDDVISSDVPKFL